MSRRAHIPDEPEVLRARDALLADTAANGLRPSVVALARHLGLSNTTFWRHYPHIARELADTRRQAPSAGGPTTERPPGPSSADPPTLTTADQLAATRRDNTVLRDQLQLAAASIARITQENHRLRQELQEAYNVRGIHPHD